MVAQTRIRDCRNRETVRAAHQETRVRESGWAVQTPAVLPRKPTLLGVETENAVCTAVIQLRKTLKDQFAARFVRMVAPHQGDAGIAGRLDILQVLDAETRTQKD